MGHADYQAFMLNQEDLASLTGYERPTFQKRWLEKNGIAYLVGGDGRLKVLIESINAAIRPVEQPKKRWALNF